MGSQPSHSEPGVRDVMYHMNKIPIDSWNNVVKTLSKVENAMSSFISTDELSDLNLRREMILYKTMSSVNNDPFLLPLKTFGGVALGFQLHNSIHIDDDSV